MHANCSTKTSFRFCPSPEYSENPCLNLHLIYLIDFSEWLLFESYRFHLKHKKIELQKFGTHEKALKKGKNE